MKNGSEGPNRVTRQSQEIGERYQNMFTRNDYMAVGGVERAEAHKRYYREIVEAMGGPEKITLPFTVERIRRALAAGDEHLNTLPLSHWDGCVSSLRGANAVLKERGDYLTLGNGVCILKQAAKMRAERND